MNRPIRRTGVQAEADRIDMELYRLQCSIERLAEDMKDSSALLDAARSVARARYPVRQLMHEQDRKATA